MSYLAHRRKGFRGTIYDGASAIYSLRRIRTDYGYVGGDVVIEARRGGDGDDEAFTAEEIADGTFESWTTDGPGNGDAWIQRWYDQSGNLNTALQLLPASQPQICSGGTLLADGALFNGTDQYLDCGFSHGTASAQSIFAVAQTSDIAANRMLIDGRDANDDGIGMFYLTASDYVRFHVDTTDVFSNTSLSANTEYLFTGIYGSTTSTFYEDGTQTDTDTGAPSSSSSTTDYKIGRTGFSSASFWQGSIQEIIIFPDDQTANRAAIDADIKTHYGIT